VDDYRPFGLEIPPTGFECVREDTGTVLVDTRTGVLLQVEYGMFG
jgi:hypothetical protein